MGRAHRWLTLPNVGWPRDTDAVPPGLWRFEGMCFLFIEPDGLAVRVIKARNGTSLCDGWSGGGRDTVSNVAGNPERAAIVGV